MVSDGAEVRKEGFINATDQYYLNSYAMEQLIELLTRERINTFECLLDDTMKRGLRAQAIDKLFMGAQRVKMEDKGIVYQAVSLVDRYFTEEMKWKSKIHNFSSDIYLTAYTSFFIVSKVFEVEPLNLSDVRNHFLMKSCTKEQILEKERQLRIACSFENEVPSMFDFVMLLSKVWKMRC